MDIPILSPAFGWIIRNIYNVFGQNYLLTLFLFAVIIKVLLLPLGIKQQKNSIKQSRMRPKEMAIRKKYAGRNDKVTQQKLNEEIMQLYQEENINPMSGCLPLLIQMPVLFALYGVIIKPLTYIANLGSDVVSKLTAAYGTAADVTVSKYSEIATINAIVGDSDIAAKVGEAMGADWNGIYEKILSMHKSFNIFGIDMTITPSINFARENLPYLLIPVLTFVFAFFSTKIIRKFTYQPQASDPAQARSLAMMDWTMPLMSVWISFSVSSAIAVYWMFQNILSAAQQILLYKLYPIPQVTEEDIKAAELSLKGKASKKPVKAAYEIDDYDKTVETDKSGAKKKDDGLRVSTQKGELTPKMKAHIKSTGKAPKARRKI